LNRVHDTPCQLTHLVP